MRTFRLAAAALALLTLTTCSGGGHESPTSPPQQITCLNEFGGFWAFYIESGCTGTITTAGLNKGTLSTVNGCRLTLDVSNPSQREANQSAILVVSFDTKKVTLERKGTVCDSIDNGEISEAYGRTYRMRFKATQSTQCCANDYFVTIQY